MTQAVNLVQEITMLCQVLLHQYHRVWCVMFYDQCLLCLVMFHHQCLVMLYLQGLLCSSAITRVWRT